MKYILLLLGITFCLLASSQTMPAIKDARSKFITKDGDLYGVQKTFIQNAGQYDVLSTNYATEKILFGYEGLGMPVLLTPSGLVHVQRKHIPVTEEEEEGEENEEKPHYTTIEKTLTMKWFGANASSEIVKEEEVAHRFNYGLLTTQAKGYKKISYKNFYPGIDLQYSFDGANKAGIEFNLEAKPGADLSAVKWNYSGDLASIKKDERGNLLVRSSIETVTISAPKAFYATDKTKRIPVEFKISGSTVQFHFPAGYDKSRAVIIDPFISNTSSLTGLNAAVAKDIDYDYAGNIYVSGGGNANVFMLAKYNASGVLQWTFNGGPITVTGLPSWNFGVNYGGFVVDKNSGYTFLSQGWNTRGVQVVRLTSAGVYDNYITTANIDFSEGWRFIWDCNNGTSKLLVAGGGSSSNLDFGIVSPPSVALTTQNITGLTNFSQDIADAIIDPRTHEMYTIFSHGHVAPNDIFKHSSPYAVGNKIWNKSSGFTNVLFERRNRPYLAMGAGDDNSINSLALNSSYLFYWDGKNLKAFSKTTGDPVGAPLIVTADTVLRQGGIIADECGNVFTGDRDGIIKVYKFDGTGFNDAAAPDITVTGFTGYNSVYDLAYDDSKRILYASGRGFVASFDVSTYCMQATYQVNIVKNCNTLTATATLVPSPPAGATLDYVLYDGSTQISTNTTGVFTGLTLGTTYTVKAIINQACSGLQTVVDFTMGGPQLSISKTPACGSNGSFTVTATNGATPYSFSIDGTNYQSGNAFSNLTAGNYNLTVKDATGCVSTSPVAILAGNNCVSATTTVVDENCGTGNGSITITAVNGTPPYTYSLNGGTFQTSNIFSNLSAGNYNIQVKDATNGTFDMTATVNSINNNNLSFTHTITGAGCKNDDGSVTITGVGGIAPFQFSLNGGVYQTSNLFTGLSSGNHTVTIKDANGCIFSKQVTVPLLNTLNVDAGNGAVICEGTDIVLNATSNGASFLWTPAASLSNATLLQPKAKPVVTTTYYITAKWGPCTQIDSVTIDVKPAPVPFAADTTICYGQSVTLNASGGSNYTWTPTTYLSNPTIFNPQVIKPASTIVYNLSAIGTNNCASVQPAKVTITVTYPIRIFAGNDTAALVNEPLQLAAIDLGNNASVNWLWSPAAGLSNPSIPNPVFVSDHDMSYLLTAVTPAGCEAQDSITIKVYKSADIFVASAFSPNGDGKNEVLKAVPVGIKKFNRFSVYNRWGQLLFTTTDPSKGWDGKISGVPQASAAFVWIASGIDFKGRLMERKGTTVLIR